MVVRFSNWPKVTRQVAGLVFEPSSLTTELFFLITAVCCHTPHSIGEKAAFVLGC